MADGKTKMAEGREYVADWQWCVFICVFICLSRTLVPAQPNSLVLNIRAL